MFALRLLLLCTQSAAVNIFVKPADLGENLSGGAGLGTAMNPHNSLVLAFKSMTTPGPYTVYLGFTGTKQVLMTPSEKDAIAVGKTSTDSPPGSDGTDFQEPANKWAKNTSVTVKSWWCSDNNSNAALCDSTNSLRQTVSWLNYLVKIRVMEGSSLTWQNVVFTGERLLDPICSAEYCRHCIYEDLLYHPPNPPGVFLSGTGHSFTESEAETGPLVYAPKCGREVEKQQLIVFSLETKTGTLTFTNVKFSEFRVRLSAVINVYMGTLTLTNVDFENMEPGYLSVNADDDYTGYLSANGIITASVPKKASPTSVNKESYCLHPDLPPEPPVYVSCPTILWNGGSVTGLNRDYNRPNIDGYDSAWYGAVAALMAKVVSITNVDFHDNFAPVSDLKKGENNEASALINVACAGKVVITSCTFSRNMAKKGMIFIIMKRRFLNSLNSDNVVLSGLTMSYSFSSFSPSGITIASIENINIKITSCTFSYGHGQNAGSALSITSENISNQDNIGYFTRPFIDSDTGLQFSNINPLKTVLYDLQFDHIYAGNSDAGAVTISKVATVSVDECKFTSVKGYGADSITSYSMWQYLVDRNLMRPGALPNNPAQQQTIQGVVSISSAIEVEFTDCTFTGNAAGAKSVLSATGYKTLLIDSCVFSGNTAQGGNNGIAMELGMCPTVLGSYIEVTTCSFTSNTSFGGGGALGVVHSGQNTNCNLKDMGTVVDVQRVRFTSPVFTGNDGGIYIAASELIVTSGTFTSNASQSAVRFQNMKNNNSGAAGNKLTITTCTFSSNSVMTGAGADVYIEDFGNSEQLLALRISDSTFTGSSASRAASIHMEGSVLLGQPGSEGVITNCQFKNTLSITGEGAIRTGFTGVLLISSTTFSGVTTDVIEGVSWIAPCHDPNPNRDDSTKPVTYLQLTSVTLNGSSKAMAAIMINYTKADVRTVTCTFSNIANVVISNIYGYYVDTGSTFTGVSGSDHSYYKGEYTGKAWFTNTAFKNGYYSDGGGAINLINKDATVTITGATFEGNSSISKGGAIYISTNAVATITNCSFQNNQARAGSAIYVLTSLSATTTITNCSFRSNSGQGVIFLLEGRIKIVSSLVDSNISTTAPGIYSLLSYVTTVSCKFANHECTQGCFVFAIASSTFSDTGSTFTNSKSSNTGSIIVGQSSTISLSDSSISTSVVTKNGALHVLDSSTLTLSGVRFSNCITTFGVTGGASVMHVEQSTVSISSVYIEYFNNMALYFDNTLSVAISGLTITYGNATAMNGGGLWCLDCAQLSIQTSVFQNIASNIGGCLMLEGMTFANYTITNTKFVNCNATMGGAIYAEDKGLVISFSNFTNNNAQKSSSEIAATKYSTGRGGGLYLLCSDKLKCRSTIKNTTFTGNSAYSNGGAICWEDYEPVFDGNVYSGNSATYGNNIASYAISVLSWTNTTRIVRELSATLSNVASGQVGASPPITMALYDKYGQVVTTDIFSSASLNSDLSNTSLSGIIKVNAVNGTFNFSSYGITAKPGSNTQIYVTSDGVDTTHGASQQAATNIEVNVRYCVLGEILTSAEACLVCEANTYSLTEDATYCTPCPSSAVCLKGAMIYPQSGYWRSKNTTDKFFACPRPASCLGNDNYMNETGLCATGYSGHFCDTCASGYSRTAKNTCQACPDPAANGLRLGGISVAVVILIVFLVRSTMNSALRPKELTSVYLRILMNYLQLVMLTASFNLNWPSLVKSLLSSQESAGTATAQIFSFDCYMGDISSVNVLYQKLIMFFMMPGFVVFVSFVYWSFVAARRYDFAVMRNQMVATIIILLFLVHPNIVQTMFAMLSCTEIDPGEMWLVDDPSIRCWKGDHLFYTLAIAIPGVAAWCLGIPTAALLLIAKNRRELTFIGIKAKYGFLYNGYRPEHFYWEFVIIYRKILIIFISVFVSSISVDVQALSVMMVILIAFHLQHTCRPYGATELNDLELLAIFTSGITIYSGLYFLTDDLGESSGIAFFAIIVASNSYFLTYWFFGLNRAYLEKFAKMKPRLILKLCRCIPSVLKVAINQIKSTDLQNFDVVETKYQRIDKRQSKTKSMFTSKKEAIIEDTHDDEEDSHESSSEGWMKSDQALYLEVLKAVFIIQRKNSAEKEFTLRPAQEHLDESTILDLDGSIDS